MRKLENAFEKVLKRAKKRREQHLKRMQEKYPYNRKKGNKQK